MGSRAGIFLSLEGGEGSGKTTQLGRIVAFLRDRGRHVLETREPGGTTAGELIRDILLHRVAALTPRAELALYLASRSQLTDDVIRPALAEGIDVVCDRFADSSTAYQGGGRDLGLAFVEDLNEWATTGLRPDLTFFFDLPPATGLARRSGRGGGDEKLDRIESETLPFHERVRASYLEIAQRHPERFRVIPAARDAEEVWADVRGAIEALLAGSAGPTAETAS